MHIVILGGTNDHNGILSDFTKRRIEKCYTILDSDHTNVNVHFSGSFRFNDTNIIHSQICCNYFNQINEKKYDVNVHLHTNKTTIEEAIHFGEYFKNCGEKIKIITNDWHMNRVKYLFEKTFEFYNIKNYELINVVSETIDETFIQNETNKVKELIEKPYGLWKEWLVNNYKIHGKNILLTYANGDVYEESQKNMDRTFLTANIHEHIQWNLNKIRKTIFYENNKKLLDIELGNGYWSWKPYIILEQLKILGDNDILIYMDASRYETYGFKNSCMSVINFMKKNNIDIIPGFENFNKNDIMIKDSCLKYFNLDNNKEFLDKNNIFTSPMFIRKTDFTMMFIKEWMDNCLVENNVSYEDLSYKNGKIHIYDQAVLNCLLYKYDIKSYKPYTTNECEFRKFTYYFNYFLNQSYKNMEFKIGSKILSLNNPTYFIAELSCNHNGSLAEALKVVRLAKESGADAVKTQTYTGDSITLKCDNEYFKLKNTNWDDKNTLWELFNEAHTPWEWNKIIKEETEKLGMDFLSSPFDETAVDHLEELNVTAYKIASMEIIDIPLLKKVALTKKPVIVSTGMASLSEIEEAVKTLKQYGTTDILLLKCTSSYPADPKDANLKTIKHLSDTFGVLTGLSDHTLGITVPVTAYALGARLVEKHFISDRKIGGPDSSFSLEPHEFKDMIDSIRIAEKAIGNIHYGGVKGEMRIFRRSLFIIKDIQKGDLLIEGVNVRSIRPGDGLHSRHMDDICGKKASRDIKLGTPVSWDMVVM